MSGFLLKREFFNRLGEGVWGRLPQASPKKSTVYHSRSNINLSFPCTSTKKGESTSLLVSSSCGRSISLAFSKSMPHSSCKIGFAPISNMDLTVMSYLMFLYVENNIAYAINKQTKFFLAIKIESRSVCFSKHSHRVISYKYFFQTMQESKQKDEKT